MCNHKKWTSECVDCDYRFKTVKRYSHTREVVFPRRKSRNKFYFGIELEVECGCSQDEVMDAIKDHVTDVWEFKHDGSLMSGIEFESQPLSFGQWEHYKDVLDWVGHLPKTCRSHDTQTCGLHIHVNRDGFDRPSDIKKINYFLQSNRSKFEKLGRREWRGYYNSNPNWYSNTSSRKYHALNLSRDDTIEFRFPKGTLYVPTIRATIALINAVCEIVPTFTKAQLENEPDWCWEQFLEAIATGNRGTTSKHMYKCKLHTYLNKKGLWSKELTRKFKES